jgi:hypothetical protein
MPRNRDFQIGELRDVPTKASVEVPQNRRWLVKTIEVRMLTSAVPGNRRQVTQFTRGALVIKEVRCPFSTSASLAMLGTIATGVPNSSSVPDQVFSHAIGEIVCVGEESVNCFDLNNIDPAGDRFHIRVFADTERGR